MASEKQVQRWTAKRRSALVLSILRGETSAQEAARKHGLMMAELEDWQERFLSGAENSLRAKPRDDEALKEEELRRLKQMACLISSVQSFLEDGSFRLSR